MWIDGNSRLTVCGEGSGSGGDWDDVTYAVEFNPDQVRVQKIYQVMTGTSYNVDIPIEVDLTKTMMYFHYSTDHWSNQWRYHLVTGSFVSSTQLNFARNVSSGGIYLTIYLIECLQDQWYVSHYDGGSDTDTYSYDPHNWKWGTSGRLVQGSYSISNSNYYCDRACYRLFSHSGDAPQSWTWNRNNSTDTQTDRHTESMEFHPSLGIRIFEVRQDIPNGSSSEVKGFGASDGVDLDRSIICPTIVNNMGRSDGTGTDDSGAVCARAELTGTDEVTLNRYNKGVNSYSHFLIVEWPEFKSHYFSGNVTERGIPIERTVSCFRSDTNELMDSTVSASGTGYYHLETTYSGSHYIVAQDDDAGINYNHLILGKMEPYPLPTYSGGQIIYG
jgi:hypothetical protein